MTALGTVCNDRCHSEFTGRLWLIRRLHVECICRRSTALLSHDLAGIELHEHGAIRFELLHWYR